MEMISLTHQHCTYGLYIHQDSVFCDTVKDENSFLLQAASPGLGKSLCLVSLPSNLMNFVGHREGSVLHVGPPLSKGGGST